MICLISSTQHHAMNSVSSPCRYIHMSLSLDDMSFLRIIMSIIDMNILLLLHLSLSWDLYVNRTPDSYRTILNFRSWVSLAHVNNSGITSKDFSNDQCLAVQKTFVHLDISRFLLAHVNNI